MVVNFYNNSPHLKKSYIILDEINIIGESLFIMSKGKNFYLIHKSNPNINDTLHTSNRSLNIFETIEPKPDYFPTCPTDNPFKRITRASTEMQFQTVQTKQSKSNLKESLHKIEP